MRFSWEGRYKKRQFTCVIGWLFLLILSRTLFGEPAELPSPMEPFLETDDSSLEARIESLSESHRKFLNQLDQVLKDNEALTKRLNELQPRPLKGESSDLQMTPKEQFGTQALFDSFHLPTEGKPKHWYDKLSIRGYSQFRFGRALSQDAGSADPSMFSDRSISGSTGTFSIRRARMILSGDISDRLSLYFQTDFANNPADGSNTFFAQLRDLYGDIYLDTDRVHRIRVGQSKIPWGFEEMQSSGNRVPLDRSDAIDTGDTPNQRDLGTFYYWTPVDKQKLLKDLVDGGLKGSGNYGIFGIGVYNGQGGSQLDQNRNLHTVARVTWPFQLPSGQAVEMSLQGFVGKYVVGGSSIRPLGGGAMIPAGVGSDGLREQRIAGTFVWYPQPLGFQTEWNVGEGPGLSNSQTTVQVRSLEGGYAMIMYKLDTQNSGIFIPFSRYQHYRGGYRSLANAPFGTHDEYDFGVEWQIRKELELVVEYGFVNGISLNAINEPGVVSYQNFVGQLLRCQLQINY